MDCFRGTTRLEALSGSLSWASFHGDEAAVIGRGSGLGDILTTPRGLHRPALAEGWLLMSGPSWPMMG